MKITFSTEERLAVFQVFEQTPWGASETDLIARDDAYEALGLGQFEKLDPKAAPPAWATAATQKGVELSAELAEYVCRAIVVQGNRNLGRITARLVRRLRAALPAPKEATS